MRAGGWAAFVETSPPESGAAIWNWQRSRLLGSVQSVPDNETAGRWIKQFPKQVPQGRFFADCCGALTLWPGGLRIKTELNRIASGKEYAAMPQQSKALNDKPKEAPNGTPNGSLIPAGPLPAGVREFSERVHGMLNGQPKDDALIAKALDGMDDMFLFIAEGLYSLASMLLGEGEESIRAVEAAIANAEVSACQNPFEARQSSRRALCAAALQTIAEREPGSLAAPEGLERASTCIDDDLVAARESGEELLRMLAGPDRDRVRSWLAGLRTAPRTIFVLRAVAGFTPAETAKLLVVHGGPEAAGWSEDAVREFCRQALCSLASLLLQASTAR
jgi:hypothetical protein